MMEYLESNRLLLRKLSKEDFQAVYNYMNDEDTVKYFVDRPFTEEKIMNIVNPTKEQEHYAIVLKLEEKVIGHLDFHLWEMKDTYDIGWVIEKKYKNFGLATEAAKLLMKYAFDIMHAHRIIATCHPNNKSSIRVCEKLKMRLEGKFVKCIYDKSLNNWQDELFYAILEEEYYHEN
jgi:ribosomal-protein-alanine N-acetyltransferase